MSTAPDLPLPEASVLPQPSPNQPNLSIVPSSAGVDEIELDEALRKAGPRLKRYAIRRLHDEHEAEEVVQEALLRAFQHKHLLATEDDLMAWLTVVTGRLVIDRLRVRGRATPVAEVPPQSRASRDTADIVVARDEARIALDALEAMPGRQASVLWAREVEGLSYDEIGDRFGMTEPSVRSLLHRARRTLRKEYAVRGGTLPGVGLVALAPWMRGLHFAGRLRHAAKRVTTATTVAATSLVVATVVPFGSHAHAPLAAGPSVHPVIKVAQSAHHRPAAKPRVAAAKMRQAAAVSAAPAAKAPARPTSTRIRAPHVCGRTVEVGCTTHDSSPTVLVHLPVPVAGKKWIGVSTDGASCAVVPSTPVVECASAEGTKP